MSHKDKSMKLISLSAATRISDQFIDFQILRVKSIKTVAQSTYWTNASQHCKVTNKNKEVTNTMASNQTLGLRIVIPTL